MPLVLIIEEMEPIYLFLLMLFLFVDADLYVLFSLFVRARKRRTGRNLQTHSIS